MRSLLILFAFILPVQLWSQRLTGVLTDAKSNQVLSYGSIYNLNQERGSISDDQGNFSIEYKEGDQIRFSYVGYESRVISPNLGDSVIILELTPNIHELSEFEVSAKSDQLYDLILNSRKHFSNEELNSKAYFELESFVDAEKVELVEAFYNAETKGANIRSRSIKNGRIGSSFHPKLSGQFVSHETSEAIVMHRVDNDNLWFPGNPFEKTKRQLKKDYDLLLIGKSNGSRPVYKLECLPTQPRSNFKCQVWIDSISNAVLRLEMSIENPIDHPFVALGEDSMLVNDFQINLDFELYKSEAILKSKSFHYDFYYQTRRSNQPNVSFSVKTDAVLYLYGLNNGFDLPKFRLPPPENSDYRQILAVPYNSFFWDNITEYRLLNKKAENDRFIAAHSIRSSKPCQRADNRFFEAEYYSWKTKRLILKEVDSIPNSNLESSLPANMYKLSAQIYLDINEFNDSIDHLSASIFDPYESFVYYPIEPRILCLVNIYFDLVEVQRLKFEGSLSANMNRYEILGA